MGGASIFTKDDRHAPLPADRYVGTRFRAIAPREAVQYVCEQRTSRAIVYGASSRNNIVQTKDLIEELGAQSRAEKPASVAGRLQKKICCDRFRSRTSHFVAHCVCAIGTVESDHFWLPVMKSSFAPQPGEPYTNCVDDHA